jgi:hypothetical protein
LFLARAGPRFWLDGRGPETLIARGDDFSEFRVFADSLDESDPLKGAPTEIDFLSDNEKTTV